MPSSRRLRGANGKPCPWCERPMKGTRIKHDDHPTRDHITPKSRSMKVVVGGMLRQTHVVTVIVCRKCNEGKKDFTLDEWLSRLELGRDPRADVIKRWMAKHPVLMDRARALLVVEHPKARK